MLARLRPEIGRVLPERGELHRPARPRPRRTTKADDAVVVRLDVPADRVALRRLAALDSRPLPRGRLVVAVVAGDIVAATPLEEPGVAIADPFLPTTSQVELTTLRAAQLRKTQPAARSRLSGRLAVD
jgi:hypothetical protein